MLSSFFVKTLPVLLLIQQSIAIDISNIKVQYSYSVNRKQYIQDISNKLLKNNFVILVGSGGVGKTHLAEFFLQTCCQNQYDIIWKIDCSQNIHEQLVELIKKINNLYNGQKIENSGSNYLVLLGKIVNFIKLNNKRVLLFFDNVNKKIEFEYILENAKKNVFKVIFTSCSESFLSSVLKIDLFKEEESLEYLKNMLPCYNDSELYELSKTLNHYPISLYQAAWYLFKNRCTNIQEYIQSYESDLNELWKVEEKLLSVSLDNFKSVRSTMNISFSNIKNNKDACNKILLCMSFMKDIPISSDTIFDIMKDFNYQKNILEQALSELVSNQHIEKNKENSFSIHRIKQEAILFGNDPKEIIKPQILVSTYFLNILKKNKNNLISFFKNNPDIIEHILSIINKSKKTIKKEYNETYN